MIAIIDYDAGNIKSVEKALQAVGASAVLTRDPEIISQADHVILPGVGSYKDAMDNIHKYGLEPVIKAVIDRKVPFLGICLGLQLLFESSEESPGVRGLGILKGKVVKFPEDNGLKIPHMGWNSINTRPGSRLFSGIQDNSYVYFVHSYYLKAEDEAIVAATADYGVKIHAAIEKDNIFACQFHPEKSSAIGLEILKNFLNAGGR